MRRGRPKKQLRDKDSDAQSFSLPSRTVYSGINMIEYLKSIAMSNKANNMKPLKQYTEYEKRKIAEIFDNRYLPPDYDEINS